MLAYNVLISLKLLDLPEDAQGWRIQTIIRHLLTVPVTVSTHARYEVARICIPAGWLRWWRLFVHQWVPKRQAGATGDPKRWTRRSHSRVPSSRDRPPSKAGWARCLHERGAKRKNSEAVRSFSKKLPQKQPPAPKQSP